MERNKRWLLWFLALSALGLVVSKPSWGWQIRDFFSSDRDREGERSDLTLKNQILQAELLKLRGLQSFDLDSRSEVGYLEAFVYSRYPFSLKDEILLDKGGEDGVRVDQPVLAVPRGSLESSETSGVLVGKVSKVFKDKSVVVTIFDDRWSSPVGIGGDRVQALLRGGSTPRLTLVNKSASLKEGDLVYNLDDNFPHGLPIGVLANLGLASDHLFFEADLEVAYNLSELPILWILKE